MSYRDYYERIDRLRTAKGWTMRKLADEAGIAETQISRVFSPKGRQRWASVSYLTSAQNVSRLANALGTTPAYLMHGEGRSEAPSAPAEAIGALPSGGQTVTVQVGGKVVLSLPLGPGVTVTIQ